MSAWDAAAYDEKHAFVWRLAADLLELLAPRPGERILDLGCGTGHLTRRIADAGAEVVGLDIDPGMIERARSHYPGLRFERGDAADFAGGPYDAVFSNAALHWVRDPEAAVRCIAGALRPGGRFVAEFGGKGNVASVLAAVQATLAERGQRGIPSPWYYPSVGEYAALLERHGLEVRQASLFDRPTPLEGGEQGLRDWIGVFGRDFLAGAGDEREPFLRGVEARLRPMAFRDGRWIVDYRRIRIVAVRVA
ncbi:MAG TPA: methyltransferase domain-containing protein [Vicinamibacteria bacterium]|nr:methyltransferase domain-containing protein [Vicinamibacteria bacterium]